MQKRLRDAAAALSARWEHLPTETQYDFARSILVRAQVHADRIDLDVGSARLVRGDPGIELMAITAWHP
jgi:hypothetical protein